jgi:hypothetical protein
VGVHGAEPVPGLPPHRAIPELIGEFGVAIAKATSMATAATSSRIATEFANIPGGYEDAGSVSSYRNMDFGHPQR